MPYQAPHIPDLKGIVQGVARVAYEVTDQEVAKFTAAEKDGFVKRLERQQFHSFRMYPLSMVWMKRKMYKRLDIRTHFATRTMVRGIKTFRVRRGQRGHRFHIGFERTALARDENNRTIPVPLYKLALILEKGSLSNNLPPRATWAPHLVDMRLRAIVVRRRLTRLILREARRRDPRVRAATTLR